MILERTRLPTAVAQNILRRNLIEQVERETRRSPMEPLEARCIELRREHLTIMTIRSEISKSRDL